MSAPWQTMEGDVERAWRMMTGTSVKASDETPVASAGPTVETLRQALRTIAEHPLPEQDNMLSANMRKIAQNALASVEDDCRGIAVMAALTKAREHIALDRKCLARNLSVPGREMDGLTAVGADALAEYDAVLAEIDAALAGNPNENPSP